MISRHVAGLGDRQASFKVFLANQPHVPFSVDEVTPVAEGDIKAIGDANGNGWRKVFNVYAKLLFALGKDAPMEVTGLSNWQGLRDKRLLRKDSNTALMFCKLARDDITDTVNIVMGKHFALSHAWASELVWVDKVFAYLPDTQTWVTPYFDYRQLTNQGIIQLVELLQVQKTRAQVS